MTGFYRRHILAPSVCAVILQFTPVVLADVDADVALARSAARSGQFDQACRLGIAALEAYPESAWDTPVLRRFIVEVSQRWLHQMSSDQQAGLLADMNGPSSAGARWTRAYILWKKNQREACLSTLLELIQSHPGAVGTEFAIRGSLVVRWPLMGHEEALEAVQAVADWAPENPGTGWALCRFTWRAGSAKRPELARRLFAEVREKHADTLAADVANRLGSGLDAIEAGDYPGAWRWSGVATRTASTSLTPSNMRRKSLNLGTVGNCL